MRGVKLVKKIVLLFLICLPLSGFADDNLSSKQAFVQAIFECYKPALPKKWEKLGLTYQQKGKNNDGKEEVHLSANVLKKKWKTATPCDPLMPAYLVEQYIKQSGNADRKFEYLMLSLENDGSYMVTFDGKP